MSRLSEILGCTEQELVVCNLDMDIADDTRWLIDRGLSRGNRDEIEAALRSHCPDGDLHPLASNKQYLEAVMWNLSNQPPTSDHVH
jgi:hypothetical protein